MFYGPGYYMIGMHAFWWLFWVAAIAVLAFGWRARSGTPGGPRDETPHEVLRRRLAAGEIAPDEYEERLALLNRDA